MQSQSQICLPLFWDNEEGAYMITLHVGYNWVDFVFDSGSCYLTAKSPECKWTKCYANNLFCRTKACPCGSHPNGSVRKDCQDHTFKNLTKALSSKHNKELHDEILYGSQRNYVKHYYENIRSNITNQNVCQNYETMQFNHDDTEYNIEWGPLIVYEIYKVKGHTNSNIFGSAAVSSSGQVKKYNVNCIETLAPENIWSVDFEEDRGLFIVGNHVCFQKYNNFIEFPLLTSNEERKLRYLDLTGSQFYISRLSKIRIYNNSHELKFEVNASTKHFPEFVLFDTGTPYSYTSPKFGQQLLKRKWRELEDNIEFVFENDQSLYYVQDELRDYANDNEFVFHATARRVPSDFENSFHGLRVMMFGVCMMKNKCWTHNMRDKVMTVYF